MFEAKQAVQGAVEMNGDLAAVDGDIEFGLPMHMGMGGEDGAVEGQQQGEQEAFEWGHG